jgi:hypothetical protein
MKKRFEDKRWGLALAFLALVSLVLLAGALKTMDFRPAQPIGSSDSNEESFDPTTIVTLLVDAAEVPFWRQVTFWGGLFLIVLLISTLLSPELRKKLIRTFLRIASFAVIFLFIIKENPDVLTEILLNFPTINDLRTVPAGQEIAPPVFQPPRISPLLSFFITFGLILLSVVLLWFANRWWQKQKELMSARQPLKEIADIARRSLKDLESGQDSRDAIIQCYDRMSHVVDAKRGLYREHSMTPAEFVSRLEQAGLPPGPVTRLTRLFESVRYGGHASDATEINEAKACLTSILKYCGEPQ